MNPLAVNAREEFAILDWVGLDQEPTDRVTDGGIDVAHKIDLSAQVQGFKAQPITLLAVEARDRPGILVEVFQFQNTESAGVWLGDFDDPIILNPFDAAVFSAPAPQNPQYRQGKFSGQMGRYAVQSRTDGSGYRFH